MANGGVVVESVEPKVKETVATDIVIDVSDGREADDNLCVGNVPITTDVDGIRYSAHVKMAWPRFHKNERDGMSKLRSVITFAGSEWDLYVKFCKATQAEVCAGPRASLNKQIAGKKAGAPRVRGRNYLAMLGAADKIDVQMTKIS